MQDGRYVRVVSNGGAQVFCGGGQVADLHTVQRFSSQVVAQPTAADMICTAALMVGCGDKRVGSALPEAGRR
jgi:hypothetical protein